MLSHHIKQALIEYREYREQQILKQLTELQIPINNIQIFNEELQIAINCTFVYIMKDYHIDDVLSLLQLIVNSFQNPGIKCGPLLVLLQNCFQCLVFNDLKKVIEFMYNNINKIKDLSINSRYKCQRLVNLGLKRVPYSESISRGYLHYILSRVISFPDESGLIPTQSQIKYMQKCINEQQYSYYFKNSEIPYKFYESYWRLQKWLTILQRTQQNELIQKMVELKKIIKKNDNIIISTIVQYIKDIQQIVGDVIEYFKESQPKNKQHVQLLYADFSMIPAPYYLIKYKQNQVYRLIIMLQIMIYCMNFRQKLINNKINNNQVEEAIRNVQKNVKKYLYKTMNKVQGKYFAKILEKYRISQQKWAQLKNNGKNIPKFKIKGAKQNTQTSLNDSSTENSPPLSNFQGYLKTQHIKYQKQVRTKINVKTKKMDIYLKKLKFIEKSHKINTVSERFSTEYSFDMLNQFDSIEGDYDSLSKHSLFKWKRMRTLYRQQCNYIGENIQQNILHKNYKLIQGGEEEFIEVPIKKRKFHQLFNHAQ